MFGACLLGIALALHPVGDYYTESDFYGGYAIGARAIQHGIVDPSRYPVVGPGYEFALAFLGSFGIDLFLAAKLLSVACATATLALWSVLVRRRAGGAAALAVTVLFAGNPVFVRYAYSATTDLLGTFLASASVFVLLSVRTARASDLAGMRAPRLVGVLAPLAAGVLAALATLTRYNLLALVPAAIVSLAWLEPSPVVSRRRALSAYLLGFGVVVVPWAAYSLLAGAIPGIHLYENFGFYLNPDPSRNVQDEYGFLANAAPRSDTLLELLRGRPFELVRRSFANLPAHLGRDATELLGLPVAVLCALGAIVAIGSSRGDMTSATRTTASATQAARAPIRDALGSVWLYGALLFAALVPVFYSDRYSLPLIPVYLSFAGLLAAPAVGRLRVIPLAGRLLVLGAAGVWLVAWCVPYQRKVLELAPVETREAGRALAAISSAGERIVSRKGHVGYYSGLTVVPFPRFHTLGELADFARARGARYLYFSWYEALLRQEFAYLLDPTATVPGLTVVHVTAHNPGVAYRIGPEFGTDPTWIRDDVRRRVHVARALVLVLPDSLAGTHWLVLAADALSAGRLQDALREAERASRTQPADAFAWTLQGEALRQMNRLPEARIALGRALELDPKDEQARVGLGFCELASGDSARAAATWRAALAHTTDRDVLAAMARLYEQRGDTTNATAARNRRRVLNREGMRGPAGPSY